MEIRNGELMVTFEGAYEVEIGAVVNIQGVVIGKEIMPEYDWERDEYTGTKKTKLLLNLTTINKAAEAGNGEGDSQ